MPSWPTIYARLRVRSRLRAVLGSNMLGLLADSALFVPLAFGSFAAVLGQIIGKTIATLLTVLVLLLIPRGSWGGAAMRFYLGIHQPAWLARDLGVPLMVSHRRLAGRRTLPRATHRWTGPRRWTT